MKRTVHIGLEIHCELKTQTKMFSSAPVFDDAQPNTCVSPVDLGHPGCLPVVNKEAVRLGLLACQALHCEIDPVLSFDRKNYSYPDLPKGFQITQYRRPLGKNGYLETGDQKLKIVRLHLEEDTAKMVHEGDKTRLDFNRCGRPLAEIVTAPDLHSTKEAAQAVKTLCEILVYQDISEGRMEKGNIRVDLNVSLSEDPNILGTKVEIKNLNSVSHIRKALEYEIKRQERVLDEGGQVKEQTRRYDEKQKATVVLREKETVLDYRYIPEVNLPDLKPDPVWVKSVLDNRPPLPEEIRARLSADGLSMYEADQLMQDRYILDLYFTIMRYTKKAKEVCRLLNQEVRTVFNEKRDRLNCVDWKTFAGLIDKTDVTLSKAQVRILIGLLLEKGDVSKELAAEESRFAQTFDVEDVVRQVLAQNAQAVQDYRNGKTRVIGYLVGQVLKHTGKAGNPEQIREMVVLRLTKMI